MTRDEYLQRTHEFAPRGNRLPHAKLNPDLVREIRATAGQVTSKKWAERLSVHVRTITGVREYRTWGHVE